MSRRGLVNVRPFARKKKKHSLKRMITQVGIPLPTISFSLNQKVKTFLSRSVIIVILVTCGFFFLIRGVFFKAEFRMEKVKRSEQTIATYEDLDLFNIITAAIKGKNYYMLTTFQKDPILVQAQAKFPFVQDIHFQLETGNTLGIDVEFKAPLFKVKLGEKMFGIRGENLFFEIQSGMQLGVESFVVDTPRYLTGTTSLSGFFFEISIADFRYLIETMQQEIPNMNRFVYLAGSKRLAIFTDTEQTIYFNVNDKEHLQEQFQKYHTLQQYYPSLNKLATIDLGSLDTTKVIVRKK